MYQTAEGVQRAAKEVLTKLSIPAGKSLPDGASGAYTLLFRHECRFVQTVAAVLYVVKDCCFEARSRFTKLGC